MYIKDEKIIANLNDRASSVSELSNKIANKVFEDYFVDKFLRDEIKKINVLNPNGLLFNYRFTIAYGKITGNFNEYNTIYGFVFNNVVLSVYSNFYKYSLINVFFRKLQSFGINISREMMLNNDCAKFEIYLTKKQIESIIIESIIDIFSNKNNISVKNK